MADINLTAALREQIGPLPAWVWMAGLTGAAGAWYLYAKHKAASQQSQQKMGASPTQSQSTVEGAQYIPDYVFQNYNYLPPTTPTPTPTPVPGPTGPPGPAGPPGPQGPPKPQPATGPHPYLTLSNDTWASIAGRLSREFGQGVDPGVLKRYNQTHTTYAGPNKNNPNAGNGRFFNYHDVIAVPWTYADLSK